MQQVAGQLRKRRVTVESTAITIHVYIILVSDNAREEDHIPRDGF